MSERERMEAHVADPRVFFEGMCVRGTPACDPHDEWWEEVQCAHALAHGLVYRAEPQGPDTA